MKNERQFGSYNNKLSNYPLSIADASQNYKLMCLSAY